MVTLYSPDIKTGCRYTNYNFIAKRDDNVTINGERYPVQKVWVRPSQAIQQLDEICKQYRALPIGKRISHDTFREPFSRSASGVPESESELSAGSIYLAGPLLIINNSNEVHRYSTRLVMSEGVESVVSQYLDPLLKKYQDFYNKTLIIQQSE